jgi:hypothetical protein
LSRKAGNSNLTVNGCQYYFIDESSDVSLVTNLKPGAAA